MEERGMRKLDADIAGRLREAVLKHGSDLHLVPEEFWDDELCRPALQVPPHVEPLFRMLDTVPKKLRTRDPCLEAVRLNGFGLEFVPKKMRNRKMAFAALSSFHPCLRHIAWTRRPHEWTPLEAGVHDMVKKDRYCLEKI